MHPLVIEDFSLIQPSPAAQANHLKNQNHHSQRLLLNHESIEARDLNPM